MLTTLTLVFTAFFLGSEPPTPPQAQAVFHLVYQNLPIGILSVSNGRWTFRYTDEFRRQDRIRPLVEFPDIEKVYSSEELWPFFTMRIPNLKQATIQEVLKRERINPDDEVELLQRFGRRTTANPFELRKLVIIARVPERHRLSFRSRGSCGG